MGDVESVEALTRCLVFTFWDDGVIELRGAISKPSGPSRAKVDNYLSSLHMCVC